MKYLGIDSDELTRLGAINTAREIDQQPDLWVKVWQQINDNRPAIISFLEKVLPATQRIILTGAGTSAFIGFSLKGIIQQNTGILTEAIPTTDIVSHPKDYLLPEIPTLLISFARSGNSPESVAAVELADEFCTTCFHLVITCNEEGSLARKRTASDKLTITLPTESNDISLAMTSSYTSMLLTGLLLAKINSFEATRVSLEKISQYAQRFIFRFTADIQQIAKAPFTRAVFLGSGPFIGTATESNLKIQEFTDGHVIGKNDSYLGFRHGPKSVIDEETLLVYFYSSSNAYALKYEKDLIASIKNGTRPLLQIGISEVPETDNQLPYNLYFSEYGKALDDEFIMICYILPIQILGFFKSLELGLKPDSPSVNNDITRVVEGVQIYSLA